VGIVDLNKVDASSQSSLSSSHLGDLNLLNILFSHLLRNNITISEGNSARCLNILRLATYRIGCGDTAEPRGNSRGFTTRIGQLNTDLLALAVSKLNDLLQGCDLGVLP
jgi:hypothetical protein